MYVTSLRDNVINVNIHNILITYHNLDNLSKYDIIIKRLNNVFNVSNANALNVIGSIKEKNEELMNFLNYIPVKYRLRSHRGRHYLQFKGKEYSITNEQFDKILNHQHTIVRKVDTSYSLIYKNKTTFRVSDYKDISSIAYLLINVIPTKVLFELELNEYDYTYSFLLIPTELKSINNNLKNRTMFIVGTGYTDKWLDISNFRHLLLLDIDEVTSPFLKKFIFDISLFMKQNNITREMVVDNKLDNISRYNLLVFLQNYISREWNNNLIFIKDKNIDMDEILNLNETTIVKGIVFHTEDRLQKKRSDETEDFYRDINYILSRIKPANK